MPVKQFIKHNHSQLSSLLRKRSGTHAHPITHKYCLRRLIYYSCGAKVLSFLNAERGNRDAKTQRERSHLGSMRGSIALFCAFAPQFLSLRLGNSQLLLVQIGDSMRTTVNSYKQSSFTTEGISLIHMKLLLPTLFFLISAVGGFAYQVVEDLATIPVLTPSLAERQIAKIRLDNNLEAYLISDPATALSAAALSVETGSWHDPAAYPGMAHFLEHMLFLGTEAYPRENAYSSFIHDHGGEENAFTTTDRTLYAFSVNHEGFPGAVDRFSHLFIDPLLSPSGISRELQAVDEEFSILKEEDDWRRWMIFKETGNQDHPNHAFCIGNAQTLRKIPHNVLKEWYAQHYYANRMHLAMLSPLPIEQLVDLSEKCFTSVATSILPSPRFPDPLSSNEQKGSLICLASYEGERQLELIWEVPKEFVTQREKCALEMTGMALVQETENGLAHHLKAENLIHSLDVALDETSRDHLLFSLRLDMTFFGLEQIDKTISTCFQAIAGLKETGVSEYFFRDMQRAEKAIYQFQERECPFDTALFHVDRLVDEPLATYPKNSHISSSYDPSFILQFIHTLTPESCIFVLTIDPDVAAPFCDEIERWTQTDYGITPVDEQNLQRWAAATPLPTMGLPPPNPFLVDPKPVIRSYENKTRLITLEDHAGAKIYYAQDTTHLVPKLSALFTIYAPCFSKAFVDAYVNLLQEQHATLFYSAREAGLECSLSYDRGALRIEVDGFSEQTPLFLKQLFEALSHIHPAEEDLEESVSCFQTSDDEALSAFFTLVFEETDSSTCAESPFKQLFIEGLIYGDCSKDEALTLWNTLQQTLPADPYHSPQRDALAFSFPEGDRFLFEITNANPGSTALLVIHQGTVLPERQRAQQILSMALKEAFFDSLRTQQQTGYLTQSWCQSIHKELFQFFLVQSANYTTQDLLARFDLFLKNFDICTNIPRERFETLKQSLLSKTEARPVTLHAHAQELHALIFDDVEYLPSTLKELSYESFLILAQDLLEGQGQIAILVSEEPVE